MTYTYIPAIGKQVKLKTFGDYASRNIPVWSWLEVLEVNPAFCHVLTNAHGTETHEVRVEVLNGTKHTGQRIAVPLAAIATPIGWSERYTIHVAPDKVTEVLGWLKRGIAVRQSHYMPECPTAFQPLDNCDTPSWKFTELTDTVPPEQTKDRIKVVQVESNSDAFVMRPCRYCVKGKRTRENNPVLNDRTDETCSKCGAAIGFSFDKPYHDRVSEGYSGIPVTECSLLHPRQPCECWVCNGTGLSAKYISELSTKGGKRSEWLSHWKSYGRKVGRSGLTNGVTRRGFRNGKRLLRISDRRHGNMIRVIWYFSTGRESHAHDCDTVESAYERLTRTQMEAIAWPVGCKNGAYMWRVNAENTLEHFSKYMAELEAR